MAKSPPKRPLSAASAHWAAGPVLYLAVVLSLAKVARALELAVRTASVRPFWLLPVTIAEDLLLLSAVGLLAHAIGRLRRPGLRWTLTLLVLVPIALLLPCDVLSYMLTGSPLTIQRLLGAEGATLADSNLLDRGDLIGVCAGMGVTLLALWPCFRLAARSAWLRRISRPKPQLTLLLVACALALLQGALLPRSQGLSDQPVFVLLGSFFEGGALPGLAIDARQWRELYTPAISLPPPPTAPPKQGKPPKNVVIFLGEGIPFKATGFDPRFANATDPTPLLVERWRRHGLLFDRYHANWHASIQAIFSIVCSRFPPLSGDIVRIKPRIDCGELSEVMRARGIEAGLFHSGQFSFYNKLALLGRRAYATELDAQELAKSSRREKHEWGIDDRAMVEGTLRWVDSLPKQQPFAALLIAVSPHYPYWLPSDFQGRFPGDSQEHRFLNGVSFIDTAFEELLRGFEQRGLYDDTLFVWLGDHGHYVAEPERETPGLRQFYEPNLHTPLVLINSQMLPVSLPRRARTSSRLGSHVDLLPTILDALGLPAEPRHEGQSLLSADFEARRVFFGATDGRYVGFFEGPYKFVFPTRRQGTEYYDLDRDPQELHNLSERFPERMKRYGDQALRFARAVEAKVAATPVLREDISVDNIYELFLQHVTVQLTKDGEITPCTGGPNASCPQFGPMLRDEISRVQGDRRRCVFVKVPADRAVELTLDDQSTLDLMTGTTLALPARKGRRRAIEVAVTSDAELQPSVNLTARAAIRPGYPRAKQQLRFRFSHARSDPDDEAEPSEVCLQLTNLFSRQADTGKTQ